MKYLFTFLSFILLTNTTFAQNTEEPKEEEKPKFVRTFETFRSDAGLSYNFFVGDGCAEFGTTIKGFGSGFLIDIFTGRYSVDALTFGGDKVNLSVGLGLGITKYRFADNIYIRLNENGNIEHYEDDVVNPNRDYGDGFFSYGKSKLVYGSVFVPVNLNFKLGDFYLSVGGLVDQYVSGKLKRKYRDTADDDKKVKEKVPNSEFKDFPINKTKIGTNVVLKIKKFGFGITYMNTPFFEEGKGPSLNEVRASLSISIDSKSDKKRGRGKIKNQKEPDSL